MKILCFSSDKYIIYLNKYYCKNIKDNIESYLSKIFIRLKQIYNIEVHSIFNVKCYINDIYGAILEIEKEYDPFSIYTKKTNANIKYYDTKMLYEIDDYFISDKVYMYDNKYYIDAVDNINIIEHIKNIIYGNNVNDIIDN